MNFLVGRVAAEQPSGIVIGDGRSASWMAAGFAFVSSDLCSVVCSDQWDFEQAVIAGGHCRVPIQCFGPDSVVVTKPAGPPMRARSLGMPQIGSGRSVSVERVVAETLRAAPPRSIIVTEDAAYASLIDRLAPMDHLLLDRIGGHAHGSALAIAVGAKVAAMDRAVIAIVESSSFVSGASDFQVAGRYGLPIAAIVFSNGESSYEKLASIASGHGERVDDARKLELHLRNAFSAPIPTVINAVMSQTVVAQSIPQS